MLNITNFTTKWIVNYILKQNVVFTFLSDDWLTLSLKLAFYNFYRRHILQTLTGGCNSFCGSQVCGLHLCRRDHQHATFQWATAVWIYCKQPKQEEGQFLGLYFNLAHLPARLTLGTRMRQDLLGVAGNWYLPILCLTNQAKAISWSTPSRHFHRHSSWLVTSFTINSWLWIICFFVVSKILSDYVCGFKNFLLTGIFIRGCPYNWFGTIDNFLRRFQKYQGIMLFIISCVFIGLKL